MFILQTPRFSLYCLAFFVFTTTTALIAQPKVHPLSIDEPIEVKVGPQQQHHYEIELKKGEFGFAVVQQMGIDLMVKLIDPAGNELKTFDSPNGQHGPEAVTIQAERSGAYELIVLPLNDQQPEGAYTVTLLQVQPGATSLPDRVDQLFVLWDRPGSPGASVAVVQEGKIIYTNGYGLANLEYDISNTPQTVFHIASISKQFTAFAIAMLADAGQLSLDDDIRKHLPELPEFDHTITIRHLLHHTSGLRDQWNLLAMAGWRLDDVITEDQIMALIGRQRELNFEPGAEYLYCNTGSLAFQIADMYLEEEFPEAPEEMEEAVESMEEEEEVAPMEVEPAMLEKYVGRYEIAPGFVLAINLENGQLFAQATGQSRFPLEARAPATFEAPAVPITMIFEQEGQQVAQAVLLQQNGQETNAGRLADFDPETVDIEKFTGTYVSEELGTSYTLQVEDGKLVARHQRHPVIELSPAKPDHFSGNTWFFRQIEFKRDQEGQLLGMYVSNGRVRNLWFEKVD